MSEHDAGQRGRVSTRSGQNVVEAAKIRRQHLENQTRLLLNVDGNHRLSIFGRSRRYRLITGSDRNGHRQGHIFSPLSGRYLLLLLLLLLLTLALDFQGMKY